MKSGFSSLLIAFLLALCFGCASAPVKQWYSVPEKQTVSDPLFKAEIQPFKGSDPYFVGFRLTVSNPSAKPIRIDWNSCRYLHQGKDLGVLIFRGIDPESIQGAIPADTIGAGETFAKDIFPLRTIAFLPRSQSPDPGRLGFMAGVLPGGENSVFLVVKQNDRQGQQILTVRLREETAPPKTSEGSRK